MWQIIVFSVLWLPLVFLSFNRDSFYLEHLENFPAAKTNLMFVLASIILLYYGFLLVSADKKSKTFSIKNILLSIAPLCALLALTPPMFGRDAGGYLIAARNFAVFHAPIYSQALDSVTANQWVNELGDIWWLHESCIWSPTLILILYPLAFFITKLIFAVLVYKIILAGLFLISIIAFADLTKSHKLGHVLPLAYALNPLFLIDGILEGHAEILILEIIVIGLRAFSHQRFKLGVMLLAGAVSIKYYLIVLLVPLFRSEHSWSPTRAIKILASVLAVYITVLIPFGFPISSMQSRLSLEAGLDCFYTCSPIFKLIRDYAPSHEEHLQLFLSFTLGGTFFYNFLVKNYKPYLFCFGILAVLFFFLRPWFAPWHGMIMIPFALLSETQYAVSLAYLFTSYCLIHYFGI